MRQKATFKPVLSSYTKQDHARSVMIRITVNRVHSYQDTGVSCRTENFNPTGITKNRGREVSENWISGEKNAESKNKIIALILFQLEEAYLNLLSDSVFVTADAIKHQFAVSGKTANVIDDANEALEVIAQTNNYTRTVYYFSLFLDFSRVKYTLHDGYFSGFMQYEAITANHIKRFAAFLEKTPKKKGDGFLSQGTIVNALMMIKGILTENLDYKKQVKDAFEMVGYRNDEEKQDEFLTREEFGRLVGARIENQTDLFYRDVFALCVYCQGMRISEAFSVDKSSFNLFAGTMKFKVAKSKAKYREVLLTEPALALWKTYDYDLKNVMKLSSFVCNSKKHFENVALASKIDKRIHSHLARHTFITIAKKHFKLKEVQEAIGHESIKMTARYGENVAIREDRLNLVWV